MVALLLEARGALVGAAVLNEAELVPDPRVAVKDGHERQKFVLDAADYVVAVHRAEDDRPLLNLLLQSVFKGLQLELGLLVVDGRLDFLEVYTDVRDAERDETAVVLDAEDAALPELRVQVQHPSGTRVKVAGVFEQVERDQVAAHDGLQHLHAVGKHFEDVRAGPGGVQ